MPPRVIPTLAAMADVYRQPVGQARFDAYVELGRLGLPVAGWNPMTSKDVLATVERLLDIGAEALAEEAAAEVAELLRIVEDVPLAITVATPGMWTDRLATEVEHRLQGRGVGEVLLWTGEDCGRDAVRSAAAAQVVRESFRLRHGVPHSVGAAVVQEGLALAMAGMGGRFDEAAADALELLQDDPSLSSMVAFLYGDDAATAMGFTPLGLGARVGERHAVALATRG